MRAAPLLCAIALVLAVPSLAAQELRLRAGDRSPPARLAREIQERGRYLWIDRDTVLPDTFRTQRDLIVYDADVRLEGTVEGAVAVVGGELFIRPGARVAGPIAVLGGEVYPSGLAETGEILRTAPVERVRITRTGADEGFGVEVGVEPAPGARPALLSAAPFPLPTYNRVDGLTTYATATLHPTRVRGGAQLQLRGLYHWAREAWGAGVAGTFPLGEDVELLASASRATRTNDDWIYGDLANSARAVVLGEDFRNYWESDRASLILARRPGEPLLAGESRLAPRVGLVISEDRPLDTRDPWSLWGELDRPNLDVFPADVVSAIAGAELRWRGRSSAFTGDLQVEHAFRGASDLEFTHLVAWGEYTATTFRTQGVRAYFRGHRPLGEEPAPPQRWSLLGGSGTLPTLPIGAFEGDRLVFIESSYSIPLRSISFPPLGYPTLELIYATGAAWVTDTGMPDWVQNVGLGARFALTRIRVIVDPREGPESAEISFGLSLPSL